MIVTHPLLIFIEQSTYTVIFSCNFALTERLEKKEKDSNNDNHNIDVNSSSDNDDDNI
jgi:hypothetical protein